MFLPQLFCMKEKLRGHLFRCSVFPEAFKKEKEPRILPPPAPTPVSSTQVCWR